MTVPIHLHSRRPHHTWSLWAPLHGFLESAPPMQSFMYVYSCNALSARFSAVYRALNSYFMIMIMT